jgi:O-antigen biosynthesis protein
MLRRRRPRPMRWSVVVSAPKGEAGEQWGDTWFARDLVDALQRAGEEARVVSRGGASTEAREHDDVVVVLRGLRRVVPRRGGATWLLWVISHPELVEADEPAQYDGVFAASAHWSRGQSAEFGVPVTPLLQATNPHRFRPGAAEPDSGDRLLFVGSTRGEYRPAVRAAVEAGLDLSVYGVGWEEYLPPDRISGSFIANPDLPAAYAAAGVVLNDHWPDMAAEGFLSNRLFDAAACGTRVLSDEATGLSDVFGDTVRTYADPAGLVGALQGDLDTAFPDRPARLALAERVARDHSFDARAAVLIERARELRR